MKERTKFFRSFGMIILVVVLAFGIPLTAYTTDLEEKAGSLNNELKDLQAELSETVTAIEDTAAEIDQQKENLSVAEANKQKQYEDMKLRIQYIYENGSYSMLQIIIESQSLADLQANIEYVQGISEYDNEMLEKYKNTYQEVVERDAALQGKRSELGELQTSLEEKIAGVQTAISDTNNAIAQEQQQALAAELARALKLAEAASPSQPKQEVALAEKPAAKPKPEPESEAKPEEGGSAVDALYSLSEFMRAGRISWNGYTFTYYSQSVLPGGSLNIPGRHVNADGYVSDGAGYICLAGSAPLGTVYDTPFGYQGKVYDRGTSGDHLDVYIR